MSEPIGKVSQSVLEVGQYSDIYLEMIRDLKTQNYPLRSRNLSFFFPSVGEMYHKAPKKILVVGRATNGWQKALGKELFLIKSPELIFKEHVDRNNALGVVYNQWLGIQEPEPGEKKYYATDSPFWRVIHLITMGFSGSLKENDWTQNIAWSNLYKIAPSGGGNPPDGLADRQRGHCMALLEFEIKTLNPDLVIFLTGFDWVQPFNFKFEEIHGNKWVTHQGNYSNSKLLVFPHPQGKPEGDIMDEFNKIGF